MKNMKKFLLILLAFSMVLSLFGCSKKTDEKKTEGEKVFESVELTTEDETFPKPDPDPVPVLPENMNPLTGLECDSTLVGKRPIAIMIGNTKEALPQFGLSEFDIIYEVLAEGGILRLEGIVLNYHAVKKMGSVRSARAYYAEISTAYDAIYVHSGINIYATGHVARLGVNNINATGAAFYRDQDRLNNGYPSEHTHFVDGSKLSGTIEQLKYRTELNNKEFTAFNFDPAFSSLGTGNSAKYIKVPHSGYNVSEFNYNETDMKYYHTQYANAHIDGATGEQIATENVFVLFAKHGYFSDNKSRNITLTGEGKGYYMTCGEMIPIIWKRASETGAFCYFKEDGTELSVRPGKSYISIADTRISSSVTIS